MGERLQLRGGECRLHAGERPSGDKRRKLPQASSDLRAVDGVGSGTSRAAADVLHTGAQHFFPVIVFCYPEVVFYFVQVFYFG